MPTCWVPGCHNSEKGCARLLRFPRDPMRRKIWSQNVGRVDQSGSLIVASHENSKICTDHFTADQFQEAKGTRFPRLLPTALPTIFSHNPRKVSQPREGSPPVPAPAQFEVVDDADCPNDAVVSDASNDDAVSDVSNDDPVVDSPQGGAVSGAAADVPAGDQSIDIKIVFSARKGGVERRLVSDKIISLTTGCDKDEEIGQLSSQINSLKKQLQDVREETQNLEPRTAMLLNADQLEAMKRANVHVMSWGDETVRKALQTWFACGTSGYELLIEQGFPLPSIGTIREILNDAEFESGIHDSFIKFLSIKTSLMSSMECSIILEEVPVTCEEYDHSVGVILADSEHPVHRGVPTKALLVTVCGVSCLWKQVIAFWMVDDRVQGDVYMEMLDDVIGRCHSIGLSVVNVSSSMSESVRALWALCGVSNGADGDLVYETTHPVNPADTLHFMVHVPHLIKGLAAALVSGSTIQYKDKVISVAPLRCLVNYQLDREEKLVSELTRALLSPLHFERMRVSCAGHVLNTSVSRGLRWMVSNGVMDAELVAQAEDTAWFIDKVSHWSLLMCSKYAGDALNKAYPEIYETAVSDLEEFIDIAKGMRVGAQGDWSPVQSAIIISTLSVLSLAEKLLVDDSKFLHTARLTQGGMEDLVSSVTLSNPSPTPLELRNALNTISVAQYLKPAQHSSYDQDDALYLKDYLH